MKENVAILVLAAGTSSRMGGRNKLLLPLGGRPLIFHTAGNAIAAGLGPVYIVTGHESAEVRAALAGFDVHFIDNPNFAQGMGTSLRAGIAALPHSMNACLVMLGDMPLIGSGIMRAIADAGRQNPAASAVVPVMHGEWAHPVLLRRVLFPDVLALKGDAGARKILKTRVDVHCLTIDDAAVLADADTPEAYAAIQKIYADRLAQRAG